MKKPFINFFIKNISFRIFKDLDLSKYVWHRDLNDRTVYCFCIGNFSFQNDNELPFRLKTFTKLKINTETHHRLIPKNGILVTLIIEK